jgi:hypothetical protein
MKKYSFYWNGEDRFIEDAEADDMPLFSKIFKGKKCD